MDEHQIDESSLDLETEESPNGSLATNTESANEDDKHNLVTKIKSSARGGITFATNRFGAVTAFPLMIFNGITTTIGANKILPYGTGIVVGLILSTIYFFAVVLIEIKKEHPLRRFLLILILCIGSIYTSFFAIYNQLSEGQLKYQPATKTVNAHNQFINDLRTSLNQTINNIEKENPNIGTVNLLKQEIDELRQKREEARDKDVKGEIAEQIKKRNDRLQNISSVESSYEYQVHQELNQLSQKKESQLNSYLSVEEFIESNQSSSELFAKDDSLFRDLKVALENIQGFDSNLLGKNLFQAPNYDNYVKTPTFLVPLEILLNPNSKRQISFLIFAITVSIFLEIIPLLLGGIQTEYKGNSNDVKEDIKNDNEPQNKTALGQFSRSISTLIENLKETRVEIWSALTEPIGTTKNLQNEIKNKLTKSMSAVGLNDQEKKDFLLFFYRNIDMEDKKISVNQISNSDNQANQKSEKDRSESVQQSSGSENQQLTDREKLQRFEIATVLIIDIMQNTRVKWLTKPLLPNTWLTKPLLPNKVCYHFLDSKKYQEFLAWWLDELTTNQANPAKNSDNMHTLLELQSGYEINQEWKPSRINFPIEQSEK
ncbi:MAG: hypothetical protein F6K23_06725 [Okeania sp. SIO2C9]|uniref:hypothetical protein n=1 Tax=Okeania sp. SIO2C9 TaxID=2607791 RepID=UPI0013C26475|nr:hypothetical protein [Okeania sp. SIO2C9]NEQ72789.1 hypothetical protein [Okeania sp. SIO2C9]